MALFYLTSDGIDTLRLKSYMIVRVQCDLSINVSICQIRGPKMPIIKSYLVSFIFGVDVKLRSPGII